ncbi:hypothetical protein [Nostoc commune]|uniref:hypothetical protein n=1 Tax=Nostoc commune TaxID=1178 RepID=UPI0018C7349B|nr:hypothetical protein [Nostoc commune]MBG1260791.1 hypothetical protein [Nostoc commune BAE]
MIADLKALMVFDLHKQADMLELSVAAGEIDLVVYQNHFDGWKDAINRRLYSKSIRQLFLETLLVQHFINS